MHHELLEPEIGYDEYGRYLFIWLCTCGHKGTGSLTETKMLTGYRRHLKQASRREGYW
jgi:hypothetical protein